MAAARGKMRWFWAVRVRTLGESNPGNCGQNLPGNALSRVAKTSTVPARRIMSKGEARVRVTVPVTGYRRRMFFNRFAIQWLEGHALAHFALVDGAGNVRDSYACVLSRQTLKECWDGLGKYFTRIGAPRSPGVEWLPPTQAQTDLANFIFMGHSEEAEIVLSAFATGPAAQRVKDKDEEIIMDAVAWLRCDLEIQRQFLAVLLEKIQT